MFDSAWEYQGKLSELQTEINEAIQGVQTAVSSVLKVSTARTLKQYQEHVSAVEAEYLPHLEAFEQLRPGECKESAENILNSVIRFTGFDASNCAEDYDRNVRVKLANASDCLIDFDEAVSQVQLIVVKAFVGRNTFVSPEDIQDRFSEVYKIARRIFADTKIDSDGLVRNLASSIAVQNNELENCHDSILQTASGQFSWFRSMVTTCARFESSQPRMMGRSVQPHVQLLEEFREQFAKLKYYEWKA